MINDTSSEAALLHAYRALALADRDRKLALDKEKELTNKINSLQKLIDDWYRPKLEELEHINVDLRNRCLAIEQNNT